MVTKKTVTGEIEEISLDGMHSKNSHNKSLGFKGECAAAKYLENKGLTILDRN